MKLYRVCVSKSS